MHISRSIRRPEVLRITGLSATHIYNLEKAGKFPKHFMLTPRCAAWDEGEVVAWNNQRRSNPADLDPSLHKSLRNQKGVTA